eukprot:TRINITY_DN48597_c0_g1_i1.p1 TRINITY_DN48597_c0_g1~~TRINITY_DN48597_c0_g1_i1.p1  ORF type:complete len:312 (-),score=29.12 TRINITY_DN48597_c0_g1_i1:22-957(-)
MPFSALIAFLALLFTLSAAIRQCGKQIEISGRYTCYGKGVPYSRVHFVHEVGFMRTVLGFGSTNEEGEFKIEGAPIDLQPGTPSAFAVRAAYDFHDPPDNDSAILRIIYGDVDFREIDGKQDEDLGDFPKTDDRCQAYQVFYDAIRDYLDRVGDYPPKIVYVIVDQEVDAPHTEYNEVNTGRGITWSETFAKHELAHAVRHLYHGDRGAYNQLSTRGKLRNFTGHNCFTSTNNVFAFNEGWAMYWASECLEFKYDPEAPMDIAGNVAAALRHLQSSCPNGDEDMVGVLGDNRGLIFDYSDFEAKHKERCSS